MVKTVFFCGGQGNQYFLMGKELYDTESLFKKYFDEADAFLKQSADISVRDTLYGKGKTMSAQFNSLKLTHPAIFTVQYSLGMMLIEKGIRPDLIAGISLGEFIAAALSGSITLGDALSLVTAQAASMISDSPEGAMTAVVGKKEIFFDSDVMRTNSIFAGDYGAGVFVVSCLHDQLHKIENFLKSNSLVYQVLPVEYPFHSPHIGPAGAAFLSKAGNISFVKPRIKSYSGCTADLVEAYSAEHLWDAVLKPIRFSDLIAALETDGGCCSGRYNGRRYIDLSPAGTQDGFIRKLISGKSESVSFKVMTPFTGKSLENLNDLFEKYRADGIEYKRERLSMITYMFPGQGSQSKGFGGALFDEFPEITEKASQVLGYSIKDLCLNDAKDQLNITEFTQPAIYVVNALHYYKKLKEDRIKPDYVAGHSLGEYSALLAAEVFDFETGLKIVQARGRYMGNSSGVEGLGMAALVGLDEEKAAAVLKEYGFSTIDIANLNSPYQIVISGYRADLEKAQKVFEGNGVKMFVPLKVSSAFHSRYMENAKKEFEKFIKDFTFKDPEIKVISNVTARPHKKGNIKQMLCEQIVRPVKWTETIRYLMGKGQMEFREVGAGKVLAGLLGRILKEAQPLIMKDDEEPEVDMVMDNASTVEVKDEKKSDDASSAIKEAGLKEPVVLSAGGESSGKKIDPEKLGSTEFRNEYGLKYAYYAGAMYKGISSKELVVKMGKARLLSFLGTGGMSIKNIESSIQFIQSNLKGDEPYGMNLLCNMNNPDSEDELVDLYLKYGVRNIEASAYMAMSPSIVRYRLKGLKQSGGKTVVEHRVIGKVSRPEVAEAFLSPAPERIVQKLLDKGAVTKEQAELAKSIPMADDICVEADSGGHTDMGVAYVLMPAMLILRDSMMKKFNYAGKVRIGAGGGIGTPEAAAAAIIMGAEFLVTGSINQCTVEAGTSDMVKDLLQQINVQDTEYAPAGDMFELGAKVQVMKKGLFFPARANKLYNLYLQYNSLDNIDDATKKQLEEKYFRKSFSDIWDDTKKYFTEVDPREIERAEKNPRQKMALVFRWYFGFSTQWAIKGDAERKVDFQVHCGPALGAFNQWVKGTSLEDWRNRHVDGIADKLMKETALLLEKRFAML